MDSELTPSLPSGGIVLRLFAHSAAAQPAPEPIRHVCVTLAALLFPVAPPVPHLPLLSARLLAAWWLSLPEVEGLRSTAVPLCRALVRIDWVDILRHNFLCSPPVLIRQLTYLHWTCRYQRVPTTPMELRDMFGRLEITLGCFPARPRLF